MTQNPIWNCRTLYICTISLLFAYGAFDLDDDENGNDNDNDNNNDDYDDDDDENNDDDDDNSGYRFDIL